MKLKFLSTVGLSLLALFGQAQQASWIWYPGDYEVWLSTKMQNRRTERGSFFPPFWKLDAHYVTVEFSNEYDLKEAETIEVFTEGQYNIKINGKLSYPYSNKITLQPGKHKINIKVYNQAHVPTVLVKGKTINTDKTWKVTYEDKEWIDETGKASDASATIYLPAASWNFHEPHEKPSQFKLTTRPDFAVSKNKTQGGELVDFGKETFGFVKIHGLKGTGDFDIYYGESKEEALDKEFCETLDKVRVNLPQKKDSVLELSKAFRYVNVQPGSGVSYDSISMLYEYLPLPNRGTFKSSDALLNKIYDVSVYTMELNTREFFIDGIKRDRWIWSGDAQQSYLMNYYLQFDAPSVTRTLYALRGKDPVTSHMNTIMDYTFYWFIGIYDYYLYTGDKQFIENIYPRMQTLMDYCLGRRNKDGLMEGLTGDWVFVDWADGLSKKGALSVEQVLFARSLEAMSICADIVKDKRAPEYKKVAEDMKSKLFQYYWNQQKGAFVHSRIEGNQSDNVTRYANMFGVFFDYLNDEQKKSVKSNVLLNDKVAKITTPYMRFYELEALCALGDQKYVLDQMRSYWGGMLELGATSFWEEYSPDKKGTEHLAMYGRPYGKSLCHAWGASPIYLFGKYYLGVKPTGPAYSTYLVEPELGGLQWMEGDVPTPSGLIKMHVSTKEIKISGDEGTGTIRFKSKKKPTSTQGAITAVGGNVYELKLDAGKQYTIKYTAL